MGLENAQKMRENDNEARIPKKAEMNRKLYTLVRHPV